MAMLRFHDLTLGYDRHPAVHHLDGSVPDGALLALLGPNGGGKSTLLKGIMGQLRPLGGRIELAGVERRRIAYLPQQRALDLGFPISVGDLVALGLWHRTGPFGGLRRAERRDIGAALAAVGLSGFERRAIGSLSGGQLQRALFARVLLQDAPLILLDEPFTAIDARTTADLIALVRRWHGESRTVVAVLHDLTLARAHFPDTLLLAREPVAWGPTAEVLRAAQLFRARQMREPFDDTAGPCPRVGNGAAA
jgi:zinc/manganese transport system ATP-binding protein